MSNTSTASSTTASTTLSTKTKIFISIGVITLGLLFLGLTGTIMYYCFKRQNHPIAVESHDDDEGVNNNEDPVT